MKRILMLGMIVLFCSISSAQNKVVDSLAKAAIHGSSTVYTDAKDGVATIYDDVKSLYKDDVKDLAKWSVNKADTVLSNGLRILGRGASHTYDILKYQQLVKSFHHLFYWLIGISLTILVFKKVKQYLADPKESTGVYLIVVIAVSICMDVYNALYFNEMLTGFLNPEYGALKEIIDTIK